VRERAVSNHVAAPLGWIACTTATGMPCTIARCSHCRKWLWSNELTPGLDEMFGHVVRWYHFRLLRVIRREFRV
jgi:hypothetical protein